MANWIIGIPIITLFATTALAVLVIPTGRGEYGRSTLKFLLVMMVLWSFCAVMVHSVDFPSTKFWLDTVVACGMGTSAFGVHFALQFAGIRGKKASAILIVVYFVTLCLLIFTLSGAMVLKADLLSGGVLDIQFTPLMNLVWSLILLDILCALTILIWTARILIRVTDARYVFAPILGYVIMCLGGLSNLVVSSYPVDIAANFVFALLITYGVFGRRFLRSQINQTWLEHLPVILLLGFCYIAILTFCQKWLGYDAFTSNFISVMITVIFGSSAYGYSRTLISNALFRGLFPSASRYEQALEKMRCIDISLSGWNQGVIDYLRLIAEATHFKNAALLMADEDRKAYLTKYAVGPRRTEMIGFSLDSAIVASLPKMKTGLNLEEIERLIDVSIGNKANIKNIKEIGFNYFCCVSAQDKILGIVAVGDSNTPQREEVKDFLYLACNQLALSIQNELIYESENRYRLVAENLTDVIWTEDLNLNFTYVSPSIALMTGYSTEEWMCLSREEIFTPKSADVIGSALNEELALEASGQAKTDRVRVIEAECKRKDGSTFWVEMKMSFLRLKNRPVEIIGVARTITERKQAEETLRHSQEALRNLSAHLEKTRENERSSIARELHDELGQALTALRLDLIWTKRQLSTEQTIITSKLDSMVKLVDGTTKTVREISSQLRPGILDDFGLPAAIEWAAKEFTNRTSINCQVVIEPENINLEKDMSTSIFRVFQEGLTNIMRYAEATQVILELKQVENEVRISIVDNGKGMTIEQINSPQSLGLIGMRERVYFWGGAVDINSILGKGTSINIRIPLSCGGKFDVENTNR